MFLDLIAIIASILSYLLEVKYSIVGHPNCGPKCCSTLQDLEYNKYSLGMSWPSNSLSKSHRLLRS